MDLGFLGTGALTAAIVAGLKADPAVPGSILLSPRNRERAADLAARYPDVSIATHNQAVLDACSTVFIALRPQAARDELPTLHFRRTHHVVVLIAAMTREEAASLVSPAERVTKALPIPTVAARQGATLVYPPDPTVLSLFAGLGPAIPIEDASEFAALTVSTATFAPYFQYLETIHSWLIAHGVASTTGWAYVTQLFRALGNAPAQSPDSGFMHLAAEYATPGGINEHVLRRLTQAGAFDVLGHALDEVHHRLLQT